MLRTSCKLLTVFVVALFGVAAMGGVNSRAPAQERKKAEPTDGTTVRGKLASVDTEKNTVTIAISMFDRKTAESNETNKTYTLAKDAKILQDDAAAKLADLKKGFTTIIKLDGTTAVSVSVEGGTSSGEFLSANVERNTIAIIAGRNMARQVVHLLKETKVTGSDGKAIRVQDLKLGTRLSITRSVEDDNTAIRIQVMPVAAKRDR